MVCGPGLVIARLSLKGRENRSCWYGAGLCQVLVRVGRALRGLTERRREGKFCMAARILVVNDTEEILELFRMVLGEEGGYEVITASFTPHDLREVELVKPDLVILDLIFGVEKIGWQLLEKMRLNRATADIPVIVCTAAVNEVRENEGHLTEMGVSVVLKPFDVDMLLAVVKEALERPCRGADSLPKPRESGSKDDG